MFDCPAQMNALMGLSVARASIGSCAMSIAANVSNEDCVRIVITCLPKNRVVIANGKTTASESRRTNVQTRSSLRDGSEITSAIPFHPSP
jgi:hypothetical protein